MPSLRLSLLEARDRDLVHERTLGLLAGTGVRFKSDKAVQVLLDAGCRLADNGLVRIPPELVDWAVSQAPRSVLLAGRDPARDAPLDGTATYSTVAGICPYVVDKDSGLYRVPTLADLEQITTVADVLDAFGIVWYSVSPTDGLPPEMVDLTATATMLACTTKHVMSQVLRPEEVPFALEIARLSGDGRAPGDRPVLSTIYCPVAPLQHDGEAVEAAMALAAARVPIDIFSLGLAGATAPVTLAGTMTQTNCEVLSAVVLLQLVEPGCPLIYSANAGLMDMRASRFAAATPETVLMNVAQIELAHSYGMPALSVGHVTDAADLGFRAGLEDMGFALPTRLARPDIMTGLGTLEAGQAVSLVKMLLDAEVVGYIDRVLEGIVVTDESLQAGVIAEVGAGGQYLTRRETRIGVRAGEHWMPDLLRRVSYPEARRGDPGELERAREAVLTILAEHRAVPLADGVADKVADVLAEAEVALAR